MFGKKPLPEIVQAPDAKGLLIAPPDARETALRNAALKHAVEAHRGSMSAAIVQAAENYYQFLKGEKPSEP